MGYTTIVEIQMPADIVFNIDTPFGKVRIDTRDGIMEANIESIDDAVTVEVNNSGLHVLGFIPKPE